MSILWSINESRSLRAALAALNPDAGNGGGALDALVVDIRGRVGGNIGSAGQLLDMLGSAPKPYWGSLRFIDRSGKETSPSGDAGRSQAKPFQGRSVLLIDHQTRSAGEIMAYGYKRSGFGAVFGTPTAGAVTSGMPIAMPGGLMLYVAHSSLEFDGQRIEGTGVAPDHRVERPLPYAAGADPVLDAAVDHLAKAGAVAARRPVDFAAVRRMQRSPRKTRFGAGSRLTRSWISRKTDASATARRSKSAAATHHRPAAGVSHEIHGIDISQAASAEPIAARSGLRHFPQARAHADIQ